MRVYLFFAEVIGILDVLHPHPVKQVVDHLRFVLTGGDHTIEVGSAVNTSLISPLIQQISIAIFLK